MAIPQTSPASAANFKMIDIGEKRDTQRRALASGIFFAAPGTIERIRQRTLPKGDVLVLAEVAGIQGAKNASATLPLCHPLSLTSVRVWSEVEEQQVRVFCEAKTFGKTGVEMEALCGVNTALLCIYDLTKGIDPVLRIGDICLELKEGGKSGLWLNPQSQIAKKLMLSETKVEPAFSLMGRRAVVITLSDRCYSKEAPDASGPKALAWLTEKHATVEDFVLLPDDSEKLQQKLIELISQKAPELIITTGGTGLSKRDITPESVRIVCREFAGREIAGLGELLRSEGAKHNCKSWLSRSTAFEIKGTLVLCLPGNPNAVSEGLEAVGTLIHHSLHIIAGGAHHDTSDRSRHGV